MLHHEGSLLQTRASFSNVSQILTLLRFHCWQCRYKAYLHMMRTTTRPAHCLNRHAQNKTFLQTTVITCSNDSSASNFSTRYFISSFYQLLKWYVSWEYIFAVLTVFDDWCTNRHMSTRTVPTVYQSSKTVKTAKMTIGVPIVTCLHRVRWIHKVRVRRIHKAHL